MNKVKTIYKIQAVVILALIIALIACFTLGGTAFADAVHPEDEYGNLAFDTNIAVYVKNGLQQMIIIGGFSIHFDLDYIPTSDQYYDYYVLRLDVMFIPENFATLKRFTMTPARYNNSSFQFVKEYNNDGMATIADNIVFKTGIRSMEGADYYAAERDLSNLYSTDGIQMAFGSQNLDDQVNDTTLKKFAPGFTVANSEDTQFDNYAGRSMVIRRYGRNNSSSSSDLRNDRGKSYTAVYYGTYRVAKNVYERHVAFRLNQLEIWGQAGQPSFSLSNDDSLTIKASWQNKFNNKNLLVKFTDIAGSQYFVGFLHSSSLPNIESSETTLLYKE